MQLKDLERCFASKTARKQSKQGLAKYGRLTVRYFERFTVKCVAGDAKIVLAFSTSDQ
jgi:hypothetical protein